MDDPAPFFSSSYAQARGRFLEAAEAAGLEPFSLRHPLPGLEGEELAMDVVVDGDPEAGSMLIVSSGCHGVEGYAGSGVQLFALRDAALRAQARAAGVAVAYIHALNPFGFSHLRRTTHENVDLNRNFLDFTAPLPTNDAYRRVHPLLVPERWPPPAANEEALMAMMQSEGPRALQAVVTRGQHEFPDGLFFGGLEPCWSNLTLRQVLRRTASRARRLAWIDVHTGLGAQGATERILSCDPGAAEARARAWWGATVTSIHDDSSSSTFLTGLMWTVARNECPHAEYTGIAIEYGTRPVLEVLQALRADNWLHLDRGPGRPDVPDELVRRIGSQMLDAFYIDSDEWQGNVLSQAREAIGQAITGLSAGDTLQLTEAPRSTSSDRSTPRWQRDSSSQ